MTATMRFMVAIQLVSLCACARSWATFTGEVTFTAPPSTRALAGDETIEFLEGSLESNEVILSRNLDVACVISGTKRGGFGLRFLGGEECVRDAVTFVLVEAGAANERSDNPSIALTWNVNDDDGQLVGSASETLVVDMTEQVE